MTIGLLYRYYTAEWEKQWAKLPSTAILQEGDGQRYVLDRFDTPPAHIQKHFIGTTANYKSWWFYRKKPAELQSS